MLKYHYNNLKIVNSLIYYMLSYLYILYKLLTKDTENIQIVNENNFLIGTTMMLFFILDSFIYLALFITIF